MNNTIERARGRWREILPRLGIAPSFLVSKHGPCPLCGGKDRFRFDDKEDAGSYYCGQCGAGAGIILLKKLHGWTHAEACREVDQIVGTDYRPPSPPTAPCASATKLLATKRLIAEADDRDIVSSYLSSRGLSVASPVLLGHRACPYFDDDTRRIVGRYSALKEATEAAKSVPTYSPPGAVASGTPDLSKYLKPTPPSPMTVTPIPMTSTPGLINAPGP